MHPCYLKIILVYSLWPLSTIESLNIIESFMKFICLLLLWDIMHHIIMLVYSVITNTLHTSDTYTSNH